MFERIREVRAAGRLIPGVLWKSKTPLADPCILLPCGSPKLGVYVLRVRDGSETVSAKVKTSCPSRLEGACLVCVPAAAAAVALVPSGTG